MACCHSLGLIEDLRRWAFASSELLVFLDLEGVVAPVFFAVVQPGLDFVAVVWVGFVYVGLGVEGLLDFAALDCPYFASDVHLGFAAALHLGFAIGAHLGIGVVELLDFAALYFDLLVSPYFAVRDPVDLG